MKDILGFFGLIGNSNVEYKLTEQERKRLNELQIKEDNDILTASENEEYENLVEKYRKTKEYKHYGKYAKGGGVGEGKRKEIYWHFPFYAYEFEDGMIQVYYKDQKEQFIKYAKDLKDAKFIIDNLQKGYAKGTDYLATSTLYKDRGMFYIKNGLILEYIGKNEDRAIKIYSLQKEGASYHKKYEKGGGVGKEILDNEFWKDIAHLWRTSHIDIDENGKWFNTGRYKGGVNNTSGLYYKNSDADFVVGLANSYNVELSDIKTNNPQFTAFDFYKKEFETERNKKYAAGGNLSVSVSKDLSSEEINSFIEYVNEFYGKDGIYSEELNGGFTLNEISKAVHDYINELSANKTWGGGDSLDRERVREYLSKNMLIAPNGITEKQVDEDYARAMPHGRNKRSEYFQKLHEALLYFEKTKGSKFYIQPELDSKLAEGGSVKKIKVHLEAVPNIDYDKSDWRGVVQIPKQIQSANTLEEIKIITRKFIDENDLGGGNFVNADVYENNQKIGYISYNGKFWSNQ
jgi:hypothetical protein